MQMLSARLACWSFLYFKCEDDILRKSANKIIQIAKLMMETMIMK